VDFRAAALENTSLVDKLLESDCVGMGKGPGVALETPLQVSIFVVVYFINDTVRVCPYSGSRHGKQLRNLL
jgi:hypothetical protein